MPDAPIGERAIFLSEVPAGRGDCRLAGAVVVVSAAAFIVLVPLAKAPLAAFPAFIPIYQAALFINDLITVAFLLGQSQFSRRGALSWLAGGYLFTALVAAVHALTFPGLFSPSGLLGAGPQTTAWLYVFWHGGFPVFVICLCKRNGGTASVTARRCGRARQNRDGSRRGLCNCADCHTRAERPPRCHGRKSLCAG
jgi:two-component system, sensor histidine kinase and response regulator